jgi:hypothetical protein
MLEWEGFQHAEMFERAAADEANPDTTSVLLTVQYRSVAPRPGPAFTGVCLSLELTSHTRVVGCSVRNRECLDKYLQLGAAKMR